jgi:hypothetical protein
MARTGSALIALLLLASPAFAGPEVEFYMSADRTKVGLEDTFRVDIVVSGAPQGAVVQFPAPPDFEVLSRGESTQMSFSAGPGGAGVVTSIRKHTLVMRATRAGRLTIPPAVLQTASKELKTQPLTIEVVQGRVGPAHPPPAGAQANNPFGLPPGFLPPGFGQQPDDEPFDEPDVPASDSDLFIRATVDKADVVVGEQMTYTLHIYARLDLSSVDSVKPPRLDGFFSADLKVPTTLVPENRTVNGVRYREYLLRSRALFALKPGTVTIEPAEAEITTGVLFAGRRLSRKSNPLTITVKPLPAGGNDSSLVGQWRFTREVSQTSVKLGDPVQVKLHVEGKGNVQLVKAPPLNAPAGLRVYDPETKDSTEVRGTALIGARVIEYTIVPQQTGTFELPGQALSFYDPANQAWQTGGVEPITLTVTPADNGGTALGSTNPTALGSNDGPKNQLVNGGLKSLRHTAHFAGEQRALWAQPWFAPVAVGPLALTLLLGVLGFIRGALVKETPESRKKKQAKAARKRLANAEKLAKTGSVTDFYAEVERALVSFLEARLGAEVKGLTRPELALKLTAAGVPDDERDRILRVLETCDMGRYAPGMGEASARARAVDDAAAAMELWS